MDGPLFYLFSSYFVHLSKLKVNFRRIQILFSINDTGELMDGHSWAHVLLAYLLRLVWLSEFRQLTSKPFSIRVSDFIFE